jgi:predicted Rossmann fold flavoprotein
MTSDTCDIAIIGGGAAGLAAAIVAARADPTKRILILEATHQCGTKILASGGGRCNVTNANVTPDDFNGPRNIVRNILAGFNPRATVEWFASLGVELKTEETGKLFPVSDSAHTVLDALTRRCRELNIAIQTHCRVTAITPTAPFTILTADASFRAVKVILCAGGKSLPKSGSDGSGWDIARALGHTVTPTHQALCPLLLDASFFHTELSGIAQEVELSTFANGKRIDHRRGQLLWTHFGVSGPVVMDASRHWIIAHDQDQSVELRCNLLPGQDFQGADQWLLSQASARPRASLLTLLSQRFPERVAAAFLRHAHIDPATLANQFSREQRRALTHTLTALPLPVTGPRGWNYAEVTAGGVPLSEIDYRTLQSRKVPNLYLAGEILDCDGRIGGFNFQWAWSTGHLAGISAATSPGTRSPAQSRPLAP